MYTAKCKYIENKQQRVKTRKFLLKKSALKFANRMQSKYTICMAEIKGKRFCYIAL